MPPGAKGEPVRNLQVRSLMVVTPSPILFLLLLVSLPEILVLPVGVTFPSLVIATLAMIPSVINAVVCIVISHLPVAAGKKNRTGRNCYGEKSRWPESKLAHRFPPYQHILLMRRCSELEWKRPIGRERCCNVFPLEKFGIP
jgi:hypothetical protein